MPLCRNQSSTKEKPDTTSQHKREVTEPQTEETRPTLLLNPYNSKNTYLTMEALRSILKAQEIYQNPVNLELYQQSFVHRSYVRGKVLALSKKTHDQDVVLAECEEGVMDLQPHSNERLEFLGDSIVNTITVSYLYRRFPHADEGFMTRLKTRLVQTTSLADYARDIGLDQFLVISKHVEEKCGGRTSDRILEDLFEAFMGAVFLDFSENSSLASPPNLLYHPGYSVCETFLIHLIEKCIDFEELILNDDNYKDILLRHFQQKYQCNPKYIQLALHGPAHHRIFTMGVMDKNGNILGQGEAASKKKAEQLASQKALEKMGIHKTCIQ